MVASTRLLVCCVLALAAGGAPAHAQATGAQPPAALDRLLGQTIVGIRLVVEGRERPDPELQRALETQRGSVLTTGAVRESLVHLMALQRFDEVTVDAEPAAGGVVLTYLLSPIHTVAAIDFRGNIGLSTRELRSSIQERYTSSPPVARAEEIAGMLEAIYRDRGFLKATVRPLSEPVDRGERVRLVFQIEAGPAARVGRVTVDGEAADGGEAGVQRRLGLQQGARFDRKGLDTAIAGYVDSLRAAGYLEARVEPDLAYSTSGDVVDVALRMSHGPLVSIAFRGDPLPDKQRGEIVAALSEGALDEDALENEQRRIEDGLRARGYRDASAPFQREPKEGGRLVVVFTVTRGPQYRVAAIELTGNELLSGAEIQSALQVAAGQWFVGAKLEADAEAIRDLYRKQGFRKVDVAIATAPLPTDATQLTCRFEIAEGPRTTIATVEFAGVASLPKSVLEQVITSRAGGPFSEAAIGADRDAILFQYQALGYQQASVTVPPGVSEDGSHFTLRFVVEEGGRSLLDHVLVVGNARTKTATIERALALEPGTPLSYAALTDAQRRVSALGLFRRVQLQQLERNVGNRHDLLVVVEEAPVNTIGYGGGLEGSLRPKTDAATGNVEDKFDLAPRGFFEIGRRNLWGKNRSVTLFMRGAIRSSDQFNTDQAPPDAEAPGEDTGAGFREYRVLGSYREPRFLDTPVDVMLTAAVDQAIRSSFDFNRRQINVEGSHRFDAGLTIAGRYLFGHTRRFNERIEPESQLDVDKVYSTERLSAFAGSVVLSTRDDAFEPTRGFLTAFDIMFAPRAIGSAVGFVKGSWQGFAYRQLPWMRGAVAVGGVRVGLANGFPQVATDPDGNPVIIDQELPASERFFAGGDSTVRGWALDRLGSESVLDANGVSNGGNGLVILNAELRFPFWKRKSLGGAVFVDVGNVFATVGDIDFGELRSGAGFGLRWASPVGPLRVDLAWKLDPITFANGQPEKQFAWYVTIGQAF